MASFARRVGQRTLARIDERLAGLRELRPDDEQAASFAGFGAGSTLGGQRRLLVNPGSIEIGERVTVLPGSVLEALDPTRVVIRVGAGSYLSFGVRIVALNGVLLGEQVAIGPATTLSDTIHEHKTLGPDDAPWEAQLRIGRPLRIGRLSWIGNGCVLAGGLDIGERVIVQANTTLTRDVPDRTMVAGNPARAIRRMDGDGRWRWLVDPGEFELGGSGTDD